MSARRDWHSTERPRAEYPYHSTPGYAALRRLYKRVRRLCAEAFDEPYTPDETIPD
jgi:hypothetical protein